MNEYIVDGQVYQVSDDKLEKFLKEFPNAKLKEETIEPVKTTPVEMDATAGKEIASDMESPSVSGSLDLSINSDIGTPKLSPKSDGSLYQGVVAEMKVRRDRGAKNMLLNERKGSDDDFENFKKEGLKETGLGFINTVKQSSAKLKLGINSYINQAIVAAGTGIGGLLGVDGVEEFGEFINKMD